ncbi:DNA polymerase III subunit delta' [Wolinella succinogenes]|uniref:DNA POLYMERASE III DELTA PRIME SUBUNIT HOLB n=1 Tax=Wolinella succinogenes (strain ATCC 29543 / DSM 1740 / CCUG 13145 / JCM 31913 / LMG 7466 / NCTC 11488 / FDC 602W) TaxID=273121 RepID=Q7M8C6_WOLSU|nr:DNA polymerase III subunit delta' [Wolinella succinogenes]CAE10756.1 DNA POLYMERASE III DELTA PRIME SUBUNIT HOLB [Wolinella succinogenes]VEG80907.1 DNA polymerase III subunit delta' [Wolinella succinogenes]HCZ18566.1 DNA polymerase III subunit delta' [Helicobacter sp.]
MERPSGYILLTSNLAASIEELGAGGSNEHQKLFFKEEFLIDDSKEVIAQAYIASKEPVRVIIAAQNYNLYAQNALLKILEEPPKHISFILLATSKSSLLPTIRSRLPIIDHREPLSQNPFPLALSSLSLKEVYGFLKELTRENPSKEETKRLIESLLFACKEESLPLRAQDLELFGRAIVLAEQFERPAHIFLPLLLLLLQRKKSVRPKN